MKTLLSIVIVNYKTSAFLKNCLKSIFESNLDIAFEIIILDNNSNDEGLPNLMNEYPMVRFIDMPTNKGFANACNHGISQSRADIVLLLNPDTEVLPDTINKLFNYLINNIQVGIVGPKIFYSDGSIQNKVIPKEFPTLWYILCQLTGLDNLFSKRKLFNSYFGHNFNYDIMQEVQQVNGSCMMIKKEIIKKIGFLDTNYFLYFEETDWCFSAIKNSYKVIYYPFCSIIHFEGKSSSLLKKRSVESYYEGLLYFFKKNYGPMKAVLLWLQLVSLLFIRLGSFPLLIFHHKNIMRVREDCIALLLCLNLRRMCLIFNK